jgi:hypothetical protein
MQGMKEFREALDKHMKGVDGVPRELGSAVPSQAGIDIEHLPPCDCGKCYICIWREAMQEAIDECKAAAAEIERRKKLKQH